MLSRRSENRLHFLQKLFALSERQHCPDKRGDFNIAHRPIDLARPRQNEKYTGFLPEERAFLDRFTALGYVDTFRHVHGETPGHYSWWSYKSRAREKNLGWRIDYFFVSQELLPAVRDAWIESDVYGSDHCPVGLSLEL